MRNVCILLIAISSLSCALTAQEPEGYRPQKTVVLGIDALDKKLMDRWMAEGRLPHFKQLAEQGHYSALESTHPPMSPTAWSSMITGLNPGKTGIFDFIKRQDDSYQPELALGRANEQPLIGGPVTRAAVGVGAGLALLLLGLGLGRGLFMLLRGDKTSDIFPALTVVLMCLLIPVSPLTRDAGGAAGALLAQGICAVVFGYFVRRNRLRMTAFIAPLLILCASGALAVAKLPAELPQPQTARTGDSFWKLADAHGLRTRVIGAPLSWPAKEDLERAKLTTGLATPDAMGSFHTYTLFTEPHHELAGGITEMSGRIERLVFDGNVAQGLLLGPPDKFDLARWREWEDGKLTRIPREEIPFTITRAGQGVRLEFAPGDCAEDTGFTLQPGEWQRHFRVKFDLGGLTDLHATVSFKLLAGGHAVRLYATPVQWDPLEPNARFAISEPLDFAPWVATNYGMYQTIGWAEATSALNDGAIDEDTFMETCRHSFDEKRAQLLGLLQRPDEWDMLACFTYEVDRVSHMMWRHLPEEAGKHPNYDPAAPARWRTAIRDYYELYDALLGEVMKLLPPETLLLVCSDHGFLPFYRAVNVNRWLRDNGYLVLKGEAGDVSMDGLFNTRGGYFDSVDWSRTKAYALSLSKVYLNLKGREPEGIVEPGAEAEALKTELIAGLMALRDDERHGNARVFRNVWRAENIWEGDRLPEVGDLQLGYDYGYRVSWSTSLGGANEPVIFDNLKPWSGDHCSYDPALVPGVVFSNRRLEGTRFHLSDTGLTALQAMGVPLPAGRGSRDGVPWRVR